MSWLDFLAAGGSLKKGEEPIADYHDTSLLRRAYLKLLKLFDSVRSRCRMPP